MYVAYIVYQPVLQSAMCRTRVLLLVVSASRTKFLIQLFFFKERLYLRPLFSSVISSSENSISVLFMILGEKCLWNLGVSVVLFVRYVFLCRVSYSFVWQLYQVLCV